MTELAKLKGNAGKGREVFVRNCIASHKGGSTTLTARQSRQSYWTISTNTPTSVSALASIWFAPQVRIRSSESISVSARAMMRP